MAEHRRKRGAMLGNAAHWRSLRYRVHSISGHPSLQHAKRSADPSAVNCKVCRAGMAGAHLSTVAEVEVRRG